MSMQQVVEVWKWQHQYDLLHGFVSRLAGEGDAEAAEIMSKVDRIDVSPIVKCFTQHLHELLRLINLLDEAWGESEHSSAAVEQAFADFDVLRRFVKGILEGTDISCSACVSSGALDPGCGICHGVGYMSSSATGTRTEGGPLTCNCCFSSDAEHYVPIYHDPLPGEEPKVKYYLCTSCYDTSFDMRTDDHNN